jgi:plastocyanin
MDRRSFIAAAGAAAVPLSGCFEPTLADGDYDIGMSANAFVPDHYEVSVGETVIWGNNGSRGHTVTAYASGLPDGAAFFASGGFESTEAARESWKSDGSGNIEPGRTFEQTFETAGEFPYFCIPHEQKGMTGVIVVSE